MLRFNPGATIGPYVVLDALARGGMAEVYLALNAGPSGFTKVLALKVVLPHLAHERTFARMFEDEARIAGLLNHPGIVQVYDFGVDDDVQYMAMEYVDGASVSRIMDRLKPHGLIPVPLTLRIAADVCAALEYAHTLRHAGGEPLRFVHRDVSLENILVSYAGQTKVGDFGIAKARIALNVTQAGLVKGKHAYVAPEVLRGEGIDHRADVFAMGVTLYGMLTGVLPFRELRTRGRPVPPRELMPTLPAELDGIVMRAIDDDRTRRHQSAAELQDELEALMRRTQVGLPRELAVFLAEVFPDGTDALRAKYRAAIDRATPLAWAGADTVPAAAETPTAIDVLLPAEEATRTDVSDDTVETSRYEPHEPELPSPQPASEQQMPVPPLQPDREPDDAVETARYEPHAPALPPPAAPGTSPPRPRDPDPAPRKRRLPRLLPLIVIAVLFVAGAVALALILARAR